MQIKWKTLACILKNCNPKKMQSGLQGGGNEKDTYIIKKRIRQGEKDKKTTQRLQKCKCKRRKLKEASDRRVGLRRVKHELREGSKEVSESRAK